LDKLIIIENKTEEIEASFKDMLEIKLLKYEY
jgi:hypothetical protein